MRGWSDSCRNQSQAPGAALQVARSSRSLYLAEQYLPERRQMEQCRVVATSSDLLAKSTHRGLAPHWGTRHATVRLGWWVLAQVLQEGRLAWPPWVELALDQQPARGSYWQGRAGC
ncbi:MAG TPA: hypothetical protein VFQ61_20460 [Polyangiaceae bacterium]|nr:hypothetical protein [Polyangiaceae bacterium]